MLGRDSYVEAVTYTSLAAGTEEQEGVYDDDSLLVKLLRSEVRHTSS